MLTPPFSPLPACRYDPTATDVWALGVLLFLLVSGQYPFEVGGCCLVVGGWQVCAF